MLGRKLSTKKWLALVLLTVGVAIVQLPASSDIAIFAPASDIFSDTFPFPRSLHELGQIANGAVEVAAELSKRGLVRVSTGLSKRSATYEGIEEDLGLVKPTMNHGLGCTAVLIAALVSGLTGVYFEKVLKDANTSVSVWIRNVQLSFYSLFPALFVGVILMDGEEILERGFFDGYNSVVWTAIMFQAIGGVLVALCIAYADNIAKNFATSISIIISCIFSMWFFEFSLNTAVSQITESIFIRADFTTVRYWNSTRDIRYVFV